MRFIIEESDEILTTHSSLALVGLLLGKTALSIRLDALSVPTRAFTDIANHEVAYSYFGLLCQGKSSFDHIEPFRDDEFFTAALSIVHIVQVPSSPTLRQRLNLVANEKSHPWLTMILEESARLLHTMNVPLTAVTLGTDRHYLPLDIDVSPFDNSGTKKEGGSRTYKGYSLPRSSRTGYGIHVEFWEGRTHSHLSKCRIGIHIPSGIVSLKGIPYMHITINNLIFEQI